MTHNAWLYFVILAHFINALVVIIDKHIVSTSVPRPVVYAFYVSLLSGTALVLVPFGAVSIPSLTIILYSIIAGATYVFSILCLYEALRVTDPSDAIPVVGALTAISTFIFSFVTLQTEISRQVLIGSLLLIIGTLLISHFRFTWKTARYVLLSGLLSGLSAVFVKIVFQTESFANGFFWTRMGNFLFALVLIAIPAYWKHVDAHLRKISVGTKMIIVGNKVFAGGAAFLILLAIKLAPVSLVSALAGLQYVFLLVLAVIWSKHMPEYFFHRGKPGELVHRVLSTSLIVLGFIIFVS